MECDVNTQKEADDLTTSDRLVHLAARVSTLEQHERGWTLGRVGVLVGCIGGLIGGFSTVRQLWQQWSARPNFEIVAENPLQLYWERDGRHLLISRNYALQNTGAVIGAIANLPVATFEVLSPASLSTTLEIVASANSSAVTFPLPIRASDGANLTFSMSSQLPDNTDLQFPAEGDYKLILSLVGNTSESDVYCFSLTQPLVDRLINEGNVRLLHSDPCPSRSP